MLVVALGIDRFDADGINAWLRDLESQTGADTAFGLEIHREFSLLDEAIVQQRARCFVRAADLRNDGAGFRPSFVAGTM